MGKRKGFKAETIKRPRSNYYCFNQPWWPIILFSVPCPYANYADDAKAYTCAPNADSKLPSISDKLFAWFKNNHIKANPGKCYFSLSLKTQTK